MLTRVLGPPGDGGVLDAGCGTGRHACALRQNGYTVTGADISREMLDVAERHAREASIDVRFVCTPFATLHEEVGGGFDGIFCLGNALGTAGSGAAVAQALDQFSSCLRAGGRLLLHIRNLVPIWSSEPRVDGPKVRTIDGVEYVSVRQYVFQPDSVRVTKITIWNDSGWKQQSRSGTLYPITVGQLRSWCKASGLRIDELWGGCAGKPFDVNTSADLFAAITRP